VVFFEDIKMLDEISFQKGIFKEEFNHPLHIHPLLEIGVITSGAVLLQTVKEEYVLHPGDVFIGRPFEAHAGSSQQSEGPAEWILCLFAASIFQRIPSGVQFMAPFYASNGLCPVMPASSSHAQAILNLAKRAVTLEDSRIAAWQAKQFIILASILEHIYDFQAEATKLPAINHLLSFRMLQVIEHIMKHYVEPLSMSELSSIAGLGKTQFSQNFKKITSLSPNAFINRLRIHKAMSLLLHTDLPILEIAFDCGFSTLSAFNKNFKAQVLHAPSKYRQRKGLA
jgi:AraC-like DNA-binding protein